MKRFYYILGLLVLLLPACRDQEVDITLIADTEVTLDQNAATFVIYVENQNGQVSNMTVEEYGVYLSTKNTEPTAKDQVVRLKRTDAAFYYVDCPAELRHQGKICKITCTNLASGQTYYVRPFVANSVSTLTGDVISFTTASTLDDNITITFTGVSNITTSTAYMNGKITIGKDAVGKMTELGYFYSSTSTKPAAGDKYIRSTSVSDMTAGTYDVNWQVKNLSPSTKYYVRMYYKEGSTYHYSSNVRSFTTLGNTSSVTVNDFVGYYTCHANREGYSGDSEWTIYISSFYNDDTQCDWVKILGFGGGYTQYTAYGPFDATKGYVRLQGGCYDVDDAIHFGDTTCYALMYPGYYDFNSNRWYYLSTNEATTGTSAGEILLKRNADGSLYLTASDKPDNNNRYANFVLYDFLMDDEQTWLDEHDFAFWIDGTTFTKTSSSNAPAKAPSKTLRQKVRKTSGTISTSLR